MRIELREWDGREPRALAAELRALAATPPEVAADAAAIVAQVRRRGDAALRELTARFDATELDAEVIRLCVDREELERARAALEPELAAALEAAARNVGAVAAAELNSLAGGETTLPDGQGVEIIASPAAAAGVYVPGGRASYPSSVVMCCVPARVAGVGRVAVASPPAADGRLHPAVLAACWMAGIDEVYAIGGAQAIAALAFGTETVRAVDVVAGPGNPYVNEAKRLALGRVAIDGIAGPSELVAVLDASAQVGWIALDLLAQAEHGPDSPQVAISADPGVLEQLEQRLRDLGARRASVADAPFALVSAPAVKEALALADAYAPEHLELALDGARELARDRVAGCVFVGEGGAVAFGDYAAGSNHVLPTGGAARFGRPLGVGTFLRQTAVVDLPAPAAAALAPHVSTLARAEGFPVHGESAEARAGGARPAKTP